MAIRPLEGEHAPRKIVVFDLEWYPEDYSFRLGGVYDGERYDWYDSAEELLRALCSRRFRGCYIYSHFGGAADEQFLLKPWVQSNFKVEGSFSGGSMVFAKVSRGRNVWYFLDSYWTLRRPLKEIGESVGVKKIGEEYKCAGSCAHSADKACIFYAPMPVLREYNMRDCVVLHLALTRLQDELRGLEGTLKATAASSALDLFRRQYLGESIKTHAWVNEFCDDAYIASRVEVIRPTLAAPAWVLDINSSFPWSMSQDTPGNLERSTKGWGGDELAVVDATVSVSGEEYLPALAYRARDGAVYHPTGTWRSRFTGVDLRALEETGGRIEKVHRTLLFERRQELAAYVGELYERRRKETDPFRREVYKLLMNSTYGKFGEACEKKTITIEGGTIVAANRIRYIPHRWLPIGAIVTARSRQLLGRYMREAGDVAYCDTDSIATQRGDMKTGDKLGELKREKEIKRGARFYRPKFYQIDDENIKAKGFTRLSAEQFDALIRGEPVEVKRMMRIREKIARMMRAGEIDGEGMVGWLDPLHPCDGSYTKKLSLDLRAKRASDGANDTRPWSVKELR